MDASSSQSETSPRRAWMVLLVLLLALVALLLGLVFIGRPRDTLVSDSPDRSHRIIVREGMRYLDRNFRVVLVDRPTGTERVVYSSNDQNPTNVNERFVWSKDSSKVVLVGDHYFVVSESRLENGEIIFLMYDVENDKLWCNEDHNRGFQRVSPQQVVEAFGELRSDISLDTKAAKP